MSVVVEWEPEPNGADVLEDIAAYIRRYVVLTEEQAVLLALWTLHTHAFDTAEATPYLNIKSAEKRSGKTRLLRGILNAGFRQGGVVSLCVGQGANLTYEDFTIFCPKAIAGIGRLPDTVADRSIPIELKRRSRSEKVERFRFRKVGPEALPLREAAAAWAETHLDDLKGREPNLPEALDDRAQDIIEPLLAIADEVGGDWPEKARTAAVTLLTGEDREDTESLGVRLLRDLRVIFDGENAERLPTGALLRKLRAAEDAP